MLERDLTKNPIPYSFKVRNNPVIDGEIRSLEDFYEAIAIALEAYQTDDISVALRRIGKGICPKSFPISPQSLYYLDLYGKCFGGEYGTELQHLPLSGGVLDQPNIFYSATDIISRIRSKHIAKKMKDADKGDIHRQPDAPPSDRGQSFGR